MIFDEDTHTYTLDGIVLPSVTQIIRFITREKQDKAPESARELARRRGQLIHEYCQLYDYDALPERIEAEVVPYIEGYRKFMRDYRIYSWLYSELPLASAKLGFAGTIDRVGLIDGELAIVDIKNVASVDKKAVAAQLSGYHRLLLDVKGDRAKAFYALQLMRGDYRLYGTAKLPLPIEAGSRAFTCCTVINDYLGG